MAEIMQPEIKSSQNQSVKTINHSHINHKPAIDKQIVPQINPHIYLIAYTLIYKIISKLICKIVILIKEHVS